MTARKRYQYSEHAERTADSVNLIRELMTQKEVDELFDRQRRNVKVKSTVNGNVTLTA